MIFTAEAQRRGENKLSAEQAISGQRSAISLNRAPRARRTPKGTRSTDLRCVVFLGSPYGANPSTAGLWESAPKGARTGCPRLIFEAGCLVRSARAPKPEERGVGLRHPGRPFFW